MHILVMKTGAEQYANRIYTSNFLLLSEDKSNDPIELTKHHSYSPHEEIICGINGCFGRWEIGNVILKPRSRILGVLTKKILAHDPHDKNTPFHILIHTIFIVPGKKERRYTQNYWGYNGGIEIAELLTGSFNILDEQKETYKLNVRLSDLPF